MRSRSQRGRKGDGRVVASAYSWFLEGEGDEAVLEVVCEDLGMSAGVVRRRALGRTHDGLEGIFALLVAVASLGRGLLALGDGCFAASL